MYLYAIVFTLAAKNFDIIHDNIITTVLLYESDIRHN